MAVVVVALDGGVLEGAVHPLDLAVRPGMARLGQAVLDVVLRAGELEGVGTEGLASRQRLLDRGRPSRRRRASVNWVPLSVSTVWTL